MATYFMATPLSLPWRAKMAANAMMGMSLVQVMTRRFIILRSFYKSFYICRSFENKRSLKSSTTEFVTVNLVKKFESISCHLLSSSHLFFCSFSSFLYKQGNKIGVKVESSSIRLSIFFN